jgi:phage terminase Nu1 subunit (DNA packaging protein)
MTKKKQTPTKRGSDADLFSISGAHVALNRARRTVERALHGIPPAEVRSGLKLWHMRDIVDAINTRTNAPLDGSSTNAQPTQSANYALANSRSRLAEVQAQKAELEVGVMSRQYVRVEVVMKAFERQLYVMRERLLNIPGATAYKLEPHSPHDRGAIELILRDVLYEAMEDISDPAWMERAMAERSGKRRYDEAYQPVETKEEPAE